MWSTNWQLVIENVERRMECWQVEMRWVGIVTIITFCDPHISFINIQVALGKNLEGLMRQFLWKGTWPRQSSVLSMVSWAHRMQTHYGKRP